MLSPDALTAQPLKGAIVVVGLKGDSVKTPLGPTASPMLTGDTIENLAGNAVLIRPVGRRWRRLCCWLPWARQ